MFTLLFSFHTLIHAILLYNTSAFVFFYSVRYICLQTNRGVWGRRGENEDAITVDPADNRLLGRAKMAISSFFVQSWLVIFSHRTAWDHMAML